MTEQLLKLREQFVVASDAFETAFKKFHKEQQRHSLRRGKSDGAKGHPHNDIRHLSPYGKSIYQNYVAQISDLGLELEPIITEVERDHVQAITHLLTSHQQNGTSAEELALSRKTESELSAADDRYHDKVEALDQDPELHALQSRYDEIDDQYQARAEELGRQVTDKIMPRFPKLAYWAILILIVGLGEVATTYTAFLNFEEPAGPTILIAIGAAIGLGFLAHFAGQQFSRARANRPSLAYAIAVSLAAIALIVVLASVRAASLHEEIAIRSLGHSAFFFTSMVLFLVGTFLAFTTHDSDEVFEGLIEERKSLQDQIDKKEAVLHGEKVAAQEHLRTTQLAINRKHREEMEKISSYADRAEVTLVEAQALTEQMWTGIRNLEDYLIESMKSAIQQYRDANLRARRDDYPTAWDQDVPEPPRNYRKPTDQEIQSDTTNTNDKPGLWHYNPN